MKGFKIFALSLLAVVVAATEGETAIQKEPAKPADECNAAELEQAKKELEENLAKLGGIEEERKLSESALSEATKLKAKAEAQVDELSKKLTEEKKKHDAEIAKIKSASADHPLHLIVLDRASRQYDKLEAQWNVFYKRTVLPQVRTTMSQVDEYLQPVQTALNEQFETIRPQYESQVKPHLDKASAVLNEQKGAATKHLNRVYADFQRHFATFRKQCISSLRKQNAFSWLAYNAEQTIDAVMVSVAALIFLLTFVPVVKFILAIVKSIFYYGFCCCCCRRRSTKAN